MNLWFARNLSRRALGAALGGAVLAAPAMAQESAPTSQPMSAPASQPTSAPMATDSTEVDAATAVAMAIEEAQGMEAWSAHAGVMADITVAFHGNTRVDGRLIMRPDMSRIRIEGRDGSVMVWDGETAWLSPSDADPSGVRFNILTWPYFMAAPFKLRDPGSHLEDMGAMPAHGSEHRAVKLTFDEGVGDAPDDWYIVYEDPETGLVCGMAYIVTFHSGGEGDHNPHAIVYKDQENEDGALIATKWEFMAWSEEEGPHGDPVGEAHLSHVRFVEPPDSAFERPEDSVEVPMPERE
jgi:hypothetical protein